MKRTQERDIMESIQKSVIRGRILEAAGSKNMTCEEFMCSTAEGAKVVCLYRAVMNIDHTKGLDIEDALAMINYTNAPFGSPAIGLIGDKRVSSSRMAFNLCVDFGLMGDTALEEIIHQNGVFSRLYDEMRAPAA